MVDFCLQHSEKNSQNHDFMESNIVLTDSERRSKLEVLLLVDKEWKDKKDASRFCSVGPTGILYIGYLDRKFQLIKNV